MMACRGGIVYESGEYDLVPAGRYVVEYFSDEGPEWVRAFGRYVTILLFVIKEGDYAGTLLPWWVSVEKTNRGTYRFPNAGGYMKMLRSVGRAPKRRDRCQPSRSLKGLILTADVVTVEKNAKGEELVGEARYSKISGLHPLSRQNGQANSPEALV